MTRYISAGKPSLVPKTLESPVQTRENQNDIGNVSAFTESRLTMAPTRILACSEYLLNSVNNKPCDLELVATSSDIYVEEAYLCNGNKFDILWIEK